MGWGWLTTVAHAQAANTSSPVSLRRAAGSEWPGRPSQRKVGEVDDREQLVQAWSSVGCTFVVQQATLCEAALWADVMLKGENLLNKEEEVDKQSSGVILIQHFNFS